jgi:large subunit ribosomal protein L5e
VEKKSADGIEFNVRPVKKGPRPFKAILDIGLARTTTGARIFGALKGALDGGLNIPHSEKRFYGYDAEAKKLDAKKFRYAIFAGHVADYMRKLAEEDASKYQRQFSRYIAAGITPDKLEDVIRSVHRKIRQDPKAVISTKHKPDVPKRFGRIEKLTCEERKAKREVKKKALLGKSEEKDEE